MAAGNPIVRALSYVEKKSTGEIRVHISKRLIERDPMGRALTLFDDYKMTQTTHRNGVLLYINLRRKKFAVMADEGIHRIVGQRYWDELMVNLREDLLSTYFENAIAMAVFTVGTTLERHFPIDRES